jgi:hypothetical protein
VDAALVGAPAPFGQASQQELLVHDGLPTFFVLMFQSDIADKLIAQLSGQIYPELWMP